MTEGMRVGEVIIFEQLGAVGCLTLNRPGALNAINDGVRMGIVAAFEEAEANAAIRVMLIRSACERAFSSGADIKEVHGADMSRPRPPWIAAVAGCRKPVVAAIHGYCLGGGLELALACDIRVAAPGAVFALPEIDLGLLPGGGGTQRLPRLIGYSRAIDMLMTGDRIDTAKAIEIGLVTRISQTKESLSEEVLQLARRLADKPPMALENIKAAASVGIQLSLDEGLALETRLFQALLSTDDRKEATEKFGGRRREESVDH